MDQAWWRCRWLKFDDVAWTARKNVNLETTLPWSKECLFPYKEYLFPHPNRLAVIQQCLNSNGRPDIDPSWPENIKDVLEGCFDTNMNRRPVSTWAHIHHIAESKLASNNDSLTLAFSSFLSHANLQRMELVQSKITRDQTILRGGNTDRLSNSYINHQRSCGSFTALSNSIKSNAGNDLDHQSALSHSLHSSFGNKHDNLENSIKYELDACVLEE